MQRWLPFLLILTLMVIALPVTGILAQDATATPDTTIEIDAEETAGSVNQTIEGAAQTGASVFNTIITNLRLPVNNQVAQVLLLIGGVILLVAGWYIYDFVIVIAGALIGASIGLSLVDPTNTVLQIAALLLGGVVGAILGLLLYYVAVFIIGAYIGLLLTGALATLLGTPDVSEIVLLIGAFIGGLILLGLSFQFLIFLAALVGAQMIVLALGLTDPVWLLILVVVGVVIQVIAARSYGYDIRRRPARRIRLIRRNA